MSQTVDRATAETFIKSMVEAGLGSTQAKQKYDEQAENYDKFIDMLNLSGHPRLVDMVQKYMGERQDAQFLDVAAGTGRLGQTLRARGYTVIDAVDYSEKMLEVMKKKNIYRNVLCHAVGESPMPFPDNTYDAVVMCGAVGENHIPVESFRDIARVVKPGGYVFNIFGERHLQDDCYGKNLNQLFQTMENEGLWKLEAEVKVPEYSKVKPGILLVHLVK